MLNKLSINLRVLMLIVIPLIIFGIVGYSSFKDYKKQEVNLQNTNKNLNIIKVGNKLRESLENNYTFVLSKLRQGKITWEKSTDKAVKGEAIVYQSFEDFNEVLPETLLDQKLLNEFAEAESDLKFDYNFMKKFLVTRTGSQKDTSVLAAYLVETQLRHSDKINKLLNQVDEKLFADINTNTTGMVEQAFESSKLNTALIAIGSLLMIAIGFLIARSIKVAIKELSNVVTGFSEGDFDIRAKVIGTDELATLSTAFNGLLDDRAITLSKIDDEHQELNQSVFSLLQAVADLSDRDLTIRASVTEDATGPVADALNLLAEETADTLKDVKRIANNVNQASNKVNTHLMSINKLAMKEQARAIDTADQMNVMIERLDSISNSAANTNTMAGTATESTKLAHESVSDTLKGMSDIRTTVQETGKRIKQLGERSQEISHVIEIIETIAERTTLLALNASMQAAAAGDEGKGFSVIAEEIQRLAESSGESTGQISKLVSNIQQETNATIETMDRTIEQVVDGSVKAADAAEQMKNVLDTTNELVTAVDQIATSSKDQVSISKDLKHKAESILKSTQVTGQELLSLTGLSRNMSEYAQELVTSVDVFKLGEVVDEVEESEQEDTPYPNQA